ncbi:MAG: hypothetical protein UHJ11_03680 [Paludibacteraceae bacterium]|nr:hypothetical protein [Paludibacteraceae bacterium]
MKKILFIGLLLSIALTISAQRQAQDYYWYDGAKILLERGNQEYIIYDNSLLLESDKEKLSHSENVLYPGKVNLKWGITKPNAIIEDLEHVFYRTPSYIGSEDDIVFVTHRFYVKLKQAEDFSLLQNMTKQYNVDFEQDVDLPLWYILTCGLPSVFNALELANIFYETKLFAASEPEFIGGYLNNDINAIDQATNNNSEIIKKKLYNGVLIVESAGNMYNAQGMKLR